MKIRTRLFLLLVILTLVPLALLGGASYTVARGAVREKVSEQLGKVRHELFTATVNNIAAIRGIAGEIERDDNVNLYLTYLGRRDVSFLRDIIGRVLEFQLRREPRLAAIQLFLPEGDSVTVATTGADTLLVGAPPAGITVQNGVISIPVETKHGGRISTILLHVKIDYFMDVISRASISPERPVDGFLVAEGRLFAANAANEAILTLPIAEAGLLEFAGRIAAVGPVPGTPFIVGASMPEEEFLAPIRHVRDLSIAMMLFFGLGASGVALVFATTIVRPVNEMVSVTRRLATGDLDARLTVHRPDELGELAENFNGMAGKLKSTISDLDRSLKELSGLHDASSIISRSSDLQEALELSSMLLENGFGIGRAAFFRRDDEEFTPIHAHGIKPAAAPLPVEIKSLRVAFAKHAVTAIETPDDLAMIGMAIPEILADGTRAAAIPLVAAGREAGLVLLLLDTAPDEELLQILSVIGTLLSPIVATAAESGGGLLARPILDDLEKTMTRMERLDSRCSIAGAVLQGDDAIAAADRLAEQLAKKTSSIHRLAPNILVAIFAGMGAAEAEATIVETLGPVGTTVATKAICWPDTEENPETLLARALSIER